jgi:hypothetical protein
MMKTNVRGKVKNTDLPATKALMPLFEAIVNSIHSLEELNEKLEKTTPGQIEVFIERDQSSFLSSSEKELKSITGFTIVDNGVGFNEANFKSFQTAETTFKEEKGSKGVGRFLWLKAFDRVSIESIFLEEDENTYHRKFDFQMSDEGIANLDTKKSRSKDRKTTVKLIGFKSQYQKKCRHKAETIARKILEHCLVYFLTENTPTIRLIDEDERILVNQLFDNNIQPHSEVSQVTLKNKTFTLTNIKLFSSGEDTEHAIHFCANNREVMSYKLVKSIPDLPKKLEEEGVGFIYLGYLAGEYLDEHVNAERTKFNIPDVPNELDLDDEMVSSDEITGSVLVEAKSYLAPFLSEVRENKKAYVED